MTASDGPTEAVPQNLDEALLELQRRAIKVAKDQKAEITTAKGPGFEYGYLSLGKLLEEVTPILTELGLVWRSKPEVAFGKDGAALPVLAYSMTHVASREVDRGTMGLMLRQGSPQDQGSAISYARRYALIAYLNLAPDKDEDGQVTTRQPGGENKGVKKITKAQATKIVERADQVGAMDKLRLAASHHHGDDVGTFDPADKDAAVKAMAKLSVDAGAKVNEWLTRVEQAALGGQADD